MYRLLCLITVLLCASGCIKEDNGSCVMENTMIHFKCVDANGRDLFLQNIQSVDAFIFDNSRKFFTKKRFGLSELAQFAGWRTNLPPGDYFVVCWGNVGSNSQINDFVKGMTTFDEGYIQIPGSSGSTGDPVYYAPKKTNPLAYTMTNHAFHVEAQKVNEKEMFFVCAHRTINVYIMGYANSNPQPAVVTGTQLCAKYDFYNASSPLYRNFTQTAKPATTPEGAALLATFYVGLSEVTDSMSFILSEGIGGVVLETVNLLQFVREHSLANADAINILIRFSELGVTITLPGWIDRPVTPGT